MTSNRRKTIKVDYLSRVEGEGGLYVRVRNNQVEDVELRIFEPPRFFEAFLRGRRFDEAPDITARICGICPVAYQMSSCTAMETAFGIQVDGQLKTLRRLLYCGEWIESHALHVFLLHAPDFLGYEDSIQMAHDHPELVERGLRLKKAGNELMRLIGGREIHPINVKVGGFYRVPRRSELESIAEDLKWARDAALETVRLTSTFSFPDFEPDYTFVAMRHPQDYLPIDGRIVSSQGLDIAISEYDQHFSEEHVSHSNALQSVLAGVGPYLTGPLARYNLNFGLLPQIVQDAAREAGLTEQCRNPFQSIVVRSVELLYACDEALRLIEEYEPPELPSIAMTPRAATGYGCTEAPRGILYHRYSLDDDGVISDAKIVPPTSQNQTSMESDLKLYVPDRLDLSHPQLTLECEQLIRAYDPCISCATHFLDLTLERG